MGGTGGKSQREQNIERMMRMANEPEALGSMPAFRVAINGTSTTSADVPMNAGSSSASMFSNSQVTGSGFTSDGRPYHDWDSGATSIGIPMRPDIVGTPLDALAVEGSGLRLGALAQARANGQAYYNGLIANAGNPFTAIGATYGRAFSNAAYDLADGAAGLYALATDSNVQARALNAVGNAFAHPLDTTAAAYSAGEKYLTSTRGGQMAEDVLRFGAGGFATAGAGRVVSAVGGVGLDAASATGRWLAPEVGSMAKGYMSRSGALLYAVEPGATTGLSTGKSLLLGEGNIGTYDNLIFAGTKGDNITPHHIPSARFMENLGVARGDGLAINMEQPYPGIGGRHRQTMTYGTTADMGMTPRDALAAGAWDARRIYRQDGLYQQVRPQLLDLIQQNKTTFPEIFGKKP
jgi:hypothetical protein